MIFDNPAELADRAEALTGRRVRRPLQVIDDTSNYMTIDSGMVVRLEGSDYFVLGVAKEGRFGISEQPKYWVKQAVDLEDGSRKLLKLVFHEQFTTRVGPFNMRCIRDPEKESDVLRAVRGDPRFMQGITVHDTKGNNIRVLDFIRGPTFFNHVVSIRQPYERYYQEILPDIMRRLVGCIEAMGYLHSQGLDHGDVRNDHILLDIDSGQYRWIDFDYTVNYSDYDIFSMGNVLCYALARGIVTCKAAARAGADIVPDDALVFYRYRLANLRKHHPCIDPALNDLALRFSAGAKSFFGNFEEMVSAVRAAYGRAWGRGGRG